MIQLLVREKPGDDRWEITCDNCGTKKTYQKSKDIEGWDFKKTYTNEEYQYCPSCK